MIELEVVVEAGGWDELPGMAELARSAAEAALATIPDATEDPVAATLLLTDDPQIALLNQRWRGQDKPTNVLSFPSAAPAIPGEPRQLGDVVLAFGTLAREAEADGKSLADHAAHLVVHGVLHLLGEDHATDGEADAMERIERAALAALGIADPYGAAVPGDRRAAAPS